MMFKLVRAEAVEEVEVIIKEPEIFERIAEDGHELNNYTISMDNCYMLMKYDDKTIGVWCLYPANRSTLNIHCNILEEHRHHGKESAKLILEWFVNECPEQYQKLNAEIPMIYPEVYHYTKHQGMRDEGINRLSIRKQGQLVDQWRLGITRDEVKDNA